MNALTSFFTGGAQKSQGTPSLTKSTTSAASTNKAPSGPVDSYSGGLGTDVQLLMETQAKIRDMAAGRSGNDSKGLERVGGWTAEKQMLSNTQARIQEMAADPKGTKDNEGEKYDPTNPLHQIKLQQVHDRAKTQGQMFQIQAQMNMERARKKDQANTAKREEYFQNNPQAMKNLQEMMLK